MMLFEHMLVLDNYTYIMSTLGGEKNVGGFLFGELGPTVQGPIVQGPTVRGPIRQEPPKESENCTQKYTWWQKRTWWH